MAAKKRIVLLGATGSVGENTLRVLRAHRDRLELVGLASRNNWEKLAAIAREFGVRQVGLFDESALRAARQAPQAFPEGTRLLSGIEGLCELATLAEADLVVVAVVGTTGLRPTLAAIEAGKTVGLASKEVLVLAGKFVMAAVRERGVRLLPIDSEHNAVFQCLEGSAPAAVARVTLTASGGAFRDLPLEALAQVKPSDALRHPNWAMGPKITVDSATLANKGLELIEAQALFGLRPEQLDAVLHPPSLVHALVTFADGSILAQLAPPSMTFPIQHVLLYPERAPGVEPPLDFAKAFTLDFRPVDDGRFPMLRLARQVMQAGGVAPALYNAANEVAVAAFLEGRLPFLGIPRVVEETVQAISNLDPADLDSVLALDAAARRHAATCLTAT